MLKGNFTFETNTYVYHMVLSEYNSTYLNQYKNCFIFKYVTEETVNHKRINMILNSTLENSRSYVHEKQIVRWVIQQ